MAEKVTRRKIMLEWTDRRPGDSARLVADSSRLQSEFNWHPQYSDLQTIISSAWKWHNK